jgi:hypothetical protein
MRAGNRNITRQYTLISRMAANGAKRTINRKRSFITSSERTENYPNLQLVGNGKRYGRVGGFAFP